MSRPSLETTQLTMCCIWIHFRCGRRNSPARRLGWCWSRGLPSRFPKWRLSMQGRHLWRFMDCGMGPVMVIMSCCCCQLSRWRKLRVNCRQPFGTIEHRACIGLAYVKFTTCKPRACQVPASEKGISSRAKCFRTATKRKLSSGVLSIDTDIHGGKSPKKSKQSVWQNTTKPEYLKLNIKAELQDSAVPFDSPQFPGVISGMSKLKCRNQSPDRKEIVGIKKPKVEKVVKEEVVVGFEAAEERKVEKVSKQKLVIGYGAVKTASRDQVLRLDCSPFPRKDGSMSKTKSKNRSPDCQDIVGNLKPKIEKVTSDVAVVGSQATKYLDTAQSSSYTQDRIPGTSAAALKKRKTEGFENVDIEIHAASEVEKSDDAHTSRRDVVAQAPSRSKLQSVDELGKAVRAKLEGVRGSSYKKTAAGVDDFTKILESVVFAISGIQNPARGMFRTQGLEMGAQYRPDWTSDCTLLVCAFKDTPKFKQVKAVGGTIVSKEWISECHKQRKLIEIESFLMYKGRPWRSSVYKSNCGSLEEVTQWVYDDLESTRSWLQQRDPKPEPEDLEFIAAQGIMVCFEDTIKCLQDNQGVASIVGSWECVPQAVKELIAMERGREGYLKCTRSSMLREADRLKCVYTDVLSPIFVAYSKKPHSAIQKKKVSPLTRTFWHLSWTRLLEHLWKKARN